VRPDHLLPPILPRLGVVSPGGCDRGPM